MKPTLFCPDCNCDFSKIYHYRNKGEYVCWCSECEHTFVIQITDLGLDPITMKYDFRTEWRIGDKE